MKYIVLLLLTLQLFAEEGHNHGDGHGHEHITITTQQKADAGIRRGNVRRGSIKKRLIVPGEISWNSEEMTEVITPYSGKVLSIKVKEGTFVRKGSLIATIENSETLAQFTITAPQSGTITSRTVNRGSIVDGGSSLVTIASDKNLWLHMEFYPDQKSFLEIGDDVSVILPGSSLSGTATISLIKPELNSNGTIAVRAELTGAEGWMPGMFVQSEVLVETVSEVPVVLTSAVQWVNGESVLFLPESDTVFIPQEVTLGESNKMLTEITSGLDVGRSYISKGAFALKAQMATESLGEHAGCGGH